VSFATLLERERIMPVTVLIKRRFKPGNIQDAHQMILKVRSLATLEPGYISGQTMVSRDDHCKLVIMSMWDSFKCWKDWRDNDLRKEFARKMEAIMEGPEEHEVLQVLI
jgi:heme-degrading monooxygenase HmoA